MNHQVLLAPKTFLEVLEALIVGDVVDQYHLRTQEICDGMMRNLWQMAYEKQVAENNKRKKSYTQRCCRHES